MRPPQQQPLFMGNQPYGQQQPSYQQSPPMGGMGGPPMPPPPPPRPGMNPSYPGQQTNIPYGQQHQQQGAPSSQYAPQPVSAPPSSYGPASQYGPPQSLIPGAPMGSMGGLPPPPPPPGRNSHQMYGNNSIAPPMQATPNQSYTNPSQQQSQMQNHFSQQASGYMQQQTQPPPMNSFQQQQPANQQQQMPAGLMDILGIADKAASAVQALQQNQHGVRPPMQQPQPNVYSSAAGRPQGGFQQSYGGGSGMPYQNQNSYGAPPPNKKRRTTATMQELSMNVQYVIQVCQVQFTELSYDFDIF